MQRGMSVSSRTSRQAGCGVWLDRGQTWHSACQNYAAKKYKVKTGETVWEAKNKCPGLVVVKANHSLYYKFSKYARQIYEYTPTEWNPLDWTNAWLDVSESTLLFGDGTKIANEIRERIKRELGVTVSVA